MNQFDKHRGYNRTFKENKLTLGLFFPLEAYDGSTPEMDLKTQMQLAKQAEEAQFASLFVRDILLNDPMFGDVCQIYDPRLCLSYVELHLERIALSTGCVYKLFRESYHVMKEVWNKPYPEVTTERVNLRGAEFIPKPPASDIPVLVTGFSGQSLEWIAENGNGWISFPRNPEEQRKIVESFRS